MRKGVFFDHPRTVSIRQVPDEPLGEAQVRIRTLFSGISRGTELTNYRGLNAAFRKRWDRELRLYRDAETASKRFPLESEGYEEVGTVIEVASAVERFGVGDLVCGVWGHWTEAVVDAGEVRVQKVPDGVEPILGVFLPIAHVAFNGILDAEINLGETVAVFGLGVVGQITAQLSRLSGARVVGVDTIGSRLELCRRLGGAEVLINANEEKPAERIRELTGRRGADVCIECTGSPEGLHEAIRACAYSSRVIAMGLIAAEGRGLFLGDEFHQNRIDVVSSQLFGANPRLQHRWNHERMQQTVLALMARGDLRLRDLISHTVPLGEAARAFTILDTDPEGTMEVVLTY